MNPASLDLLDPRLRPLCDAYLGAAGVPGASIAIVVADRGYHHAYGGKSLTSGEPVTADTAFGIASCTKAFVSATLASLVADGLAGWDDPVSRHVPELQLHDPWITAHLTLRDLSANRVGLPRVGLVDAGIDPSVPVRELFEGMRHTGPVHPFRERFTYLNIGHVANAVAIGRITGKGFLATLRERILEPLGMRSTSGGAAVPVDLGDVAGWHCTSDDGVVPIDSFYSDQRLGSGGLVVSGRDALQWLRLHLNGGLVDGKQVIARDALLETHTPQVVARPGKDILSLFNPGAQMAAYALGWAVSDLDGHPLVCHSGVDYGAGAMTLLLPRDGIGVAVYGNLQQKGPVPLAYVIAGTLLGLRPRDWIATFDAAAPAPKPPHDLVAAPELGLDAYCGTYAHPADGPMRIERRPSGLVGRVARAYRMDFTLDPIGAHRFALHFDHPERHQVGSSERPVLTFAVSDERTTAAELLLGPVGRTYHRHD